MQPLDESKIVEQIQNPEQRKKVFATIVAQYSEPLYWQIRKMVISHDDTDDLLQNTFSNILELKPDCLHGFIALLSMSALLS